AAARSTRCVCSSEASVPRRCARGRWSARSSAGPPTGGASPRRRHWRATRSIRSTTRAGRRTTSARWRASGPNARSARSWRFHEAGAYRDDPGGTRARLGGGDGHPRRGAVRPGGRGGDLDGARAIQGVAAGADRTRAPDPRRRHRDHVARRREGHAARWDGPRHRRHPPARRARWLRAAHRERRADRRSHRRVRPAGDPAQGRPAARAIRAVPRAERHVTDVLNTPERRVEGRAKVTGAAKYAADFTREGMLHAAFVGSPYAHALVKRIDVGAARAVPGVRAVITGADVRPARFGRRLQDWPVLAWDRV